MLERMEPLPYERLEQQIGASAWGVDMMLSMDAQSDLGPLRSVSSRTCDGSRMLYGVAARFALRDGLLGVWWSKKRRAIVAVCTRRGLYGWMDVVVVEGLVRCVGDEIDDEIRIRRVQLDPAIWLASRLMTLFGSALLVPMLGLGTMGLLTSPLGRFALYSAPDAVLAAVFALIVVISLAGAYRAIRRGPDRDAILSGIADHIR